MNPDKRALRQQAQDRKRALDAVCYLLLAVIFVVVLPDTIPKGDEPWMVKSVSVVVAGLAVLTLAIQRMIWPRGDC